MKTTTKTPRFRIEYRKNCGADREITTLEDVSIVGRYTSNSCDNEGFKCWVPDRENYRNLNYYGIVSIQIETGR